MAGVENISQYCTAPTNIPEQINLQYASSSAVVVGFVTYETLDNTKAAPPQARLQAAASMSAQAPAPQLVTGVTHMYAPPGRNSTNPSANATEFALPYMMHYITLPVTPGMKYTYNVKSGSGLGYVYPSLYPLCVSCQLKGTAGIVIALTGTCNSTLPLNPAVSICTFATHYLC